jgi:hypothetical protein
MLEKVLRDVALWYWLYLGAKPSHVGVDVHRPTAYNRQMRGQGLQSGTVLSHRYSGWWRHSRDVKPLGLGYLVGS